MVKRFSLIVDTNRYAGNFEREMTAFMTGAVGQCGVGEEEATEYQSVMEELDLDSDTYTDFTQHRVCDDGCRRPCEIAQNEGGQYYSIEIFLDDKPFPNAEFFEFVKGRARLYGNKNNIKILGFRLKETETIDTYITI